MKALGCLLVIIVVCAGIFWLSSSADLSNEDKARIAGQKVHRGWNHMREFARDFKEGWESADDTNDKDDNSKP